MDNRSKPKPELIKMVLSRAIPLLFILPLMFFLPAGTFNYWEAWLYMLCLLGPMVLVFSYLLKHDPALLERRMKAKEKVGEQKLIVMLSFPVFILGFILPGFDKRFGWSDPSPTIVILALVIFLIGYGLFFLVLRENSYASRVIEIADGQKVISSGPYAIVRHPMYSSVLLIYIFSPLALGSYWAMLPTLLIIPVLIARIFNEEKILTNNLPGYAEYQQKVKYRLIPYIW